MHGLILDRWRVVAVRAREATGLSPAIWDWQSGFAPDSIHRAERVDDIIVMTSGREVWARIAGPNWKRLRRQIRERGV